MSDITPRTNTVFFGHDDAEAQFLRDLGAGRLAHGWIISGQKGIGKATLAYRLARALLSSPFPAPAEEGWGGGLSASAEHMFPLPNPPPLRGRGNIAARIAANSHADLLVIEPLYDEKKEEHAREISVEQAREIAGFLSLTPGEGQWRVVIVDSADALNVNAANAILKILEEPPDQSVILLIAHNPGKLLPTIRSRCRSLKLKPLSIDHFLQVMQHIRPDMPEHEALILAELSGNSPGVAIEMSENQEGAIILYDGLLDILSTAPSVDAAKLYAFAEKVTLGVRHSQWRLLAHLLLALFERVTNQSLGRKSRYISMKEEEILPRLARLHPAAVWAAKWQQCADQFLLAETRHLDYKQVIITFFHSIVRAGDSVSASA